MAIREAFYHLRKHKLLRDVQRSLHEIALCEYGDKPITYVLPGAETAVNLIKGSSPISLTIRTSRRREVERDLIAFLNNFGALWDEGAENMRRGDDRTSRAS